MSLTSLEAIQISSGNLILTGESLLNDVVVNTGASLQLTESSNLTLDGVWVQDAALSLNGSLQGSGSVH